MDLKYQKLSLLRKELKIHKKIMIIKKTYNPYKYMKKSKLLILTSAHEGFPNVLTGLSQLEPQLSQLMLMLELQKYY